MVSTLRAWYTLGMIADELRGIRDREPFQPFRLRLSSGGAYYYNAKYVPRGWKGRLRFSPL